MESRVARGCRRLGVCTSPVSSCLLAGRRLWGGFGLAGHGPVGTDWARGGGGIGVRFVLLGAGSFEQFHWAYVKESRTSGGDDAESAVVLERSSRGGGVRGSGGMQQCADCGSAGLLFSEQAGGAAGAPAECGSWPAGSAGGRSARGAFASACGFESAAAKELTVTKGGRDTGVMSEVRKAKRRTF